VKSKHRVDLTWSPTGPGSVDVYRDGVRRTTTAHDGFHTDSMNNRGSAQYSYRVCLAGTQTCSNTSIAVFP
jgi:hypothetical protein